MSYLSQTNLITNKSSLVVRPIAKAVQSTEYSLYVYQKSTGVYYLRFRLLLANTSTDNYHRSCSLSLRTKYRREAMSISKEIQRLLAYYQADNPNATYEELRAAFRQFVETELEFSYGSDVLHDHAQQGLYVGLHGDQIETIRKAMVSYPLTTIQHKFLSNDVIPLHEASIQRLEQADSSELIALLDKYEQSEQPSVQKVAVSVNPSDSNNPANTNPYREVITFKKLVEQFENDKKDTWKEATESGTKASHRTLIEIFDYLGIGETDITQLDRTNILAVREVVKILPKHRQQRYKDIPLGELLERPDKPESIHINTVNNNYLIKLTAIFGWAADNGLVDNNLARKLEVNPSALDIHSEEDDDVPKVYTKDQIVRIMDACNQWSIDTNEPWKKWVPLLAAITGARLNEVSQLQVKDIKTTDSGVVYIRINQTGIKGKSIKTKSSKRLVPLVDGVYGFVLADFLQLVESRSVTEEGELALVFDGLTLMKNGYGEKVSKWFNRSLLKKVLTNESDRQGLTFHSLRDTFITESYRALIPEAQIQRIVGHSHGNITGDVYFQGYEMEALAEAIKQGFLKSDS